MKTLQKNERWDVPLVHPSGATIPDGQNCSIQGGGGQFGSQIHGALEHHATGCFVSQVTVYDRIWIPDGHDSDYFAVVTRSLVIGDPSTPANRRPSNIQFHSLRVLGGSDYGSQFPEQGIYEIRAADISVIGGMVNRVRSPVIIDGGGDFPGPRHIGVRFEFDNRTDIETDPSTLFVGCHFVVADVHAYAHQLVGCTGTDSYRVDPDTGERTKIREPGEEAGEETDPPPPPPEPEEETKRTPWWKFW